MVWEGACGESGVQGDVSGGGAIRDIPGCLMRGIGGNLESDSALLLHAVKTDNGRPGTWSVGSVSSEPEIVFRSGGKPGHL